RRIDRGDPTLPRRFRIELAERLSELRAARPRNAHLALELLWRLDFDRRAPVDGADVEHVRRRQIRGPVPLDAPVNAGAEVRAVVRQRRIRVGNGRDRRLVADGAARRIYPVEMAVLARR